MSAYAIDHLRGDGAARALAEAARVIRPRGQFLLMVVNVDWWVRVAFPSIHGHGYFSTPQDVARWRDAMTTAGFDVTEDRDAARDAIPACRRAESGVGASESTEATRNHRLHDTTQIETASWRQGSTAGGEAAVRWARGRGSDESH